MLFKPRLSAIFLCKFHNLFPLWTQRRWWTNQGMHNCSFTHTGSPIYKLIVASHCSRKEAHSLSSSQRIQDFSAVVKDLKVPSASFALRQNSAWVLKLQHTADTLYPKQSFLPHLFDKHKCLQKNLCACRESTWSSKCCFKRFVSTFLCMCVCF